MGKQRTPKGGNHLVDRMQFISQKLVAVQMLRAGGSQVLGQEAVKGVAKQGGIRAAGAERRELSGPETSLLQKLPGGRPGRIFALVAHAAGKLHGQAARGVAPLADHDELFSQNRNHHDPIRGLQGYIGPGGTSGRDLLLGKHIKDRRVKKGLCIL